MQLRSAYARYRTVTSSAPGRTSSISVRLAPVPNERCMPSGSSLAGPVTVRRSYARANGSVLDRHDIPPVVSTPRQPEAARSWSRPRRPPDCVSTSGGGRCMGLAGCGDPTTALAPPISGSQDEGLPGRASAPRSPTAHRSGLTDTAALAPLPTHRASRSRASDTPCDTTLTHSLRGVQTAASALSCRGECASRSRIS